MPAARPVQHSTGLFRRHRWRASIAGAFVWVLLGICAHAVELNVRDFGAIGDGKIHLVTEWIQQGRFKNFRELQRAYPTVTDRNWSIDEAAFELAKSKLPAGGGTLYFPAGHYVAARQSWTIRRDYVTLRGDSPHTTILATAVSIDDALSLSPYRHVGWLERIDQQFPFTPNSGARGSSELVLGDPARAAELAPGDLVFIRNGACRFDQDYGEFNEVAAVSSDGTIRFRHPFARDYTLTQFNAANSIAAISPRPGPGREGRIKVQTGDRNFLPTRGEIISIGHELFEVLTVSGDTIRVRASRQPSGPDNTPILTGTLIGKSRALLKVTRSTRGFRAENLQFIGQRKILNLSNSYDLAFTDCFFVRTPQPGTHFTNGLTIDGDGGRWAIFTRCTLRASPPFGMQFARSFGGVTFSHCTFENATVAFTEFNFDCEVSDSKFTLTSAAPGPVIIVGKSGGDFRILSNLIDAGDAPVVFDALTDIQSHRHAGEGDLTIAHNRVLANASTPVFRLNSSRPTTLTENEVTRR